MSVSLRPPELGERLPPLDGDGVRLRWMTDDDLDDLLAIWGDPTVMRFMARPPLDGRRATEAFLDSIRRGFTSKSLFQWGFTTRDDDRIIGTCTLADLDWPHRRAELGYALHRDHWRRGLTSRAVRPVLAFAFDTLGLHRVEAETDPRNLGSIRLLERMGFVAEGRLRERYFQAGEIQDASLFGLLANDWRAHRHE